MRKAVLGFLVLSVLSLTACTGRFVKPNASDDGLAAKVADHN